MTKADVPELAVQATGGHVKLKYDIHEFPVNPLPAKVASKWALFGRSSVTGEQRAYAIREANHCMYLAMNVSSLTHCARLMYSHLWYKPLRACAASFQCCSRQIAANIHR